jgi:galactonate dehydratase
MKMDRRKFTKTLALAAGALAMPSWPTKAAAAKLPVNKVTKIRCYYPPNYQSNGPQAFPQSNMVVLVDTEAGITGIGQGGSPDTVRNMARSVIGKNAFDTEFIWQHGFMDGFYSPGKERLHALGAIDLALWDIKGKALDTPLYELFGGWRPGIGYIAWTVRLLRHQPAEARDREAGAHAVAMRPMGLSVWPEVAALSTRDRESEKSAKPLRRFVRASDRMAIG